MRLISPALALLLALSASAATAAEPFGIQVLDEVTGRGVPMVTLETKNGIRLVTDSAGWASFDEPGLMRQRVYFGVSSPGYAFPKDAAGVPGIALETRPGATTEIKVLRLNVAERLYRITGQGIYRDSTLLGKEAPLPSPNLMSGVLSQGDAQVAFFHGHLFWTWGDTRQAGYPHSLIPGTSATSELPAAKGLDPMQGIHFQYTCTPEGNLQPLLQGKEPGSVRLEGLLSVKDSAGADHLVAHYRRTQTNGKTAEQGIVELGAEQQFERLVVLGEDYTWQFPQGHAVRVTHGDQDHYYFATPLAHVRVPASYEAMLTPSNYEALAWDEEHGEVRWQKTVPPMTPADEARWIDKRRVSAKDARCQLRSNLGESGPMAPTSGSIQWNAYAKVWLMLFSTANGDVFCTRSASIEGPWQKAVQVAAHPGYSFCSVLHLAALDQEGGKIIYFQGSLGAGEIQTPRYDGNALMYRLDLGDHRIMR